MRSGPRNFVALSLMGALLHPGMAQAQPELACAAGALVYKLDEANATGWQHDIMEPIPPEIAYFAGDELIIERGERVLRYATSGGGSGLRIRVGRATELDEDDPEAGLHYVFYDIADRVKEGEPGNFLMINGDIYWPTCASQ